jgi:transposase
MFCLSFSLDISILFSSNGYLLPPYLEELIPGDHVARVVNKVVDLRDIMELTSQEKIEGRPAYHS